jgi:hypothetical protein
VPLIDAGRDDDCRDAEDLAAIGEEDRPACDLDGPVGAASTRALRFFWSGRPASSFVSLTGVWLVLGIAGWLELGIVD